MKLDGETVDSLKKVSIWSSSQSYEQAAISDFLNVADYYLVSYGLAHNMTIVTHEKPSNSKKKIKIPDACQGLGIQYISPYQMLREEQARLILKDN